MYAPVTPKQKLFKTTPILSGILVSYLANFVNLASNFKRVV